MTSVNSLAGDPNALNSIRAQVGKDPKAAVREAAKQFETLFMQELMKSMRATTLDTGMLDSDGGQMATGMLDQQMASQMSGMKGGLADAIARQLERQMGMAPGPIPSTKSANNTALPLDRPAGQPLRIPERGAAGFVEQHTAAADHVAAATGIPAAFMVGQAAHESGWGKREILHADGSPSYNLFGIKAGGSWQGPVAEITTTEYVGGQPQKVVAKFRAYASYEESFRDFARLMQNSPRYQGVLGADTANEYASTLQRAGYATDPAYADKLTRVINTTLRLQRSGG